MARRPDRSALRCARRSPSACAAAAATSSGNCASALSSPARRASASISSLSMLLATFSLSTLPPGTSCRQMPAGPRPNRCRRLQRRGHEFRRAHIANAIPAPSTASLIERSAAALHRRARGWAAVLGCVALVLAGGMPDPGWARAGSGGYSRPSIGSGSFSTRRPSIGGSGGYSRPSAPAPVFGGSSAGDRAMSRGQSSEALRNYRASQQPPPSYAPPTYGSRSYAPPPAASGGASSGGGWLPGGGWGTAMPRRAPSWGGGWNNVSPRRSFGTGVVSGVALWAALNALSSSPSQAEYFREHRSDPAYREWRQEAESQAARDPEVAAKLAELDRRMAQLDARPGSTGGGPAVAREPAREPRGGGGFSLWGIVLVIAGIVLIALLWLWRRRPPVRPSLPRAPLRVLPAPPSRASGSGWSCRSIRRRFTRRRADENPAARRERPGQRRGGRAAA